MARDKCEAESYGSKCTNKATTLVQFGGRTHRVCNGHIRGEVIGPIK